jgi:hypothetical protein
MKMVSSKDKVFGAILLTAIIIYNMGFTNRIYKGLERAFIKNAKDSDILVEAAQRRGTDSVSNQLDYSSKDIQEQTIKKYKNAISEATDRDSPSRSALSELYDNLKLDNHLGSVIDTRILFCQRSAFKFVNDSDKENKELSWLFERPWFEELIYKVIYSRFQGTTVLELFELNEDGELAQITEIPQPHVIAPKGIIIKEIGDEKGWDYKTGPFANYYLQIGRDYDLGMLELLAPIVLAKKLGMGSWLDYIDRFGVPPIFITTDREDPKRQKELLDAGMNFKSSQVVVGRGNEKIEFGEVGGQGVAPFDTLITRADEQISKRVLGGSGLTDEKAFVGSADIQYKILKDRYESDKLYFKYIFNAHIKPRLLKLSPAYAGLNNHYFEWDNTESLTQKEIIDTISKLGSIYEIDPEYITTVTGIPVLGARVENNPVQAPGGGPKGK